MLQINNNINNDINNNINNNIKENNNKLSVLKYSMCQDLKKLPQNKLSLVMNYSVSLLSEKEYYLALLIPVLTNYQYSWNLSNSILYNLAALNTIYDLEHMLNNKIRNTKPCCHIFLGESISQLAALCSTVRSNNIIIQNDNISNQVKRNIIEILHEQELDCQPLYENIGKFTKNTETSCNETLKILLSRDVKYKKAQLIIVSFQISLLLNQEVLDLEIIKELSNLILDLLEVTNKKTRQELVSKILLITYETCLEKNIKTYLEYFKYI